MKFALEGCMDDQGSRLEGRIDTLTAEMKAGFDTVFAQTQAGFDDHRSYSEFLVQGLEQLIKER